MSSIEAQQKAIENMIKKEGDASYKKQKDTLKQAKDSQVTDVKKAYNNAIEGEKLAQNQAKEDYTKQNTAVRENAYIASENTNVIAQSRGIQNSQQMLGMQASDKHRTNSLLRENLSERDRRLADIKHRMNTIKMNKELDVSGAKRQYDLALSAARAGIDAGVLDKIVNLRADDLRSQRELRNALEQMDVQQRYALENMAKQHGYDLTLQGNQFSHNKSMQGSQFSHDRSMQDSQFSHNASMQNSQQSFQREMTQVEFQNSQKIAEQNFQRQSKLVEDEYGLALSRELAKYTPGTTEYEIAKRKLEQEKNSYMDELKTKTLFEAQMQAMGQVPHPGDKPKKKFFEKQSTYNARVKEWEQSKKKYDEAQKFLTP